MDHDPTTVVSEGVLEAAVPADAPVPQRLRVYVKEWHWIARTLQAWRAREEIPLLLTSLDHHAYPDHYHSLIHTLELDLGHAQEDLGYLRNLREHYWTMMADQEQFDLALRTACDRLVGTERRLADLEERTTAAE
ncbi:hypothetical protein L1987_27648 [Smallanthus sonchifolius]|uniref:Uncharacterized protein n=1 Tax=Smallanthus sonchifolius TaxID=185202 RepID=A0ACB9IBG4_9ASTR|nr:hypothetical protein L1987_27648 [Smallanthus sonchifolius]